MAAFQFTVQQISFASEDLPVDSSSVDSLSSVVDPNVDFITSSENNTLSDKAVKTASNKEWFQNTSKSPPSYDVPKMTDKTDNILCKSEANVFFKSLKTEYPTIPLAVAHYINENNPEICQEVEKYLYSESFKKAAIFEDMQSLKENAVPSSPLHSMSVATEALALQHSVIGNMGVKPVSADIVAQVVANTKMRIEQGSVSSIPSQLLPENLKKTPIMKELINKSDDRDHKSELIRYPSESISSTVEKRSWFSSVPSETINDYSPKFVKKYSTKENIQTSRSSSQSSIQSCGRRKSQGTVESDMPKVHSTKNVSKLPRNKSDVNVDSPYEIYPDSSVEYETESSISEKFEIESMCSEAFETESNFSEISGVDDEMFQLRRSQDPHKNLLDNNFCQDGKMIHNGTQVSMKTTHANTSPFKSLSFRHQQSTANKATETTEFYEFQLLREKANLEGRLESASKDQYELIKERDNYRSLATSFEAQLKSLQSQLDAAILEKKNVLKLLDAQNNEHKNWDNVIKEYQNIIESKNNEIKVLKDDLSESEQANIRAKISYEELKVDMESKDGAVAGLKKKIAELHVEVQVLLQGKIQLENEVKNVRLEMETLQKSKDWFQEQLHATQENRNKVHQELISVQSDQVVTSNNLEKVIAEKNQLRQELIHTQQRAVAEKEVLMKHLETIEADMKERESLFDEIEKDKGTAEAALVERIRKIEEEKSHLTNLTFTMSDQEYQINVLKSECEEKTKLIQSLEKEKAELTKQIAVLQKSSNDKDLHIQRLAQQVKDINVKMNHLEMALSRSEELVNNLKEERTATDVALAAANEEKRAVNESLKAVSENLNRFKYNFKHMKAELVTRTSQAEQLLKEKQLLEETIKKNEENMLLLRGEFEQQTLSENQNRDVMLDDLKKKKSDVESVLDVYGKDLLNYQQTIENLNKQKAELASEVSHLKSYIESETEKIKYINEENISLKKKVFELECMSSKLDMYEALKSDTQVPAEESSKKALLLRGKKILYKKLKEKIKECEDLKNELEMKKENDIFQEKNAFTNLTESYQKDDGIPEDGKKLENLESRLEVQQKLIDEQTELLKKNEETIIQLERERGKAEGLADKYEGLKQRMAELEIKLSEKDSKIIQLNCEIDSQSDQLSELGTNTQNQLSALQLDLNKEKALIKSLRQQVFQEKRSNSHLQRDLSSLKSALEQANQIADSKKQEIVALKAELSVKLQAELKHRAEIEHFQTEIRLQQSEVGKLNKELEEVKARDPALAEQIKALSWRLKEKTNEVNALKEKLCLVEERHRVEVEGLKQSLQIAEGELESIKSELTSTREEKFSYQSKVIELRKALKSKLAELESKGILRVENKTSTNGPVIHLNIPDPEVSFDESYVNNLLQKSMHLSESRPLSNLQECLNSLKKEMVQLQKKIIDSAET